MLDILTVLGFKWLYPSTIPPLSRKHKLKKKNLIEEYIVECSLLDKEERRDYNLIINGTFNEMKNNLEQWKKNLNIIEAMDSVL